MDEIFAAAFAAQGQPSRGARMIRLGILLLSLSLLNACSLLGSAAKEGVISAAGHPGLARFTLEGSLPPASSLQYNAHYQPEKPMACTFYSPNVGGEVPRKHVRQEETGNKAEAQRFSYRIPLSYHKAGCEMKLTAVQLNVYITHAPGDFGTGTGSAALAIYDNAPGNVPHFPSSGVRELRGKCMWLFKISSLRYDIDKILVCHKADEHWQVPQDYDQRSGVGASLRRDELDGKTVRVEFQQSEEERPFYRGTWLNTRSGWKPCIETDKYLRCQNPPTFTTFQMNGRECTVYPNCTE